MIEAKYTFSEENLAQGYALHFKYKRRLIKFLPYFGILFLLAAIVSFNHLENEVFLQSIFVCLLFFGIYFWVRYQTRKGIRKLPSLGHDILWQFDENNVSATTQGGHFSQKWASMADSIISETGILVYPQDTAFYWLPKTAFSSQQDFDQLKQYVQKQVPKHKVV